MNALTLSTALAELDAYYLATSGAVTAASALGVVPSETINGARAMLRNVDFVRGKLSPSGSLGAGVLDGSVSIERWTNVLNAQGLTLQGIWETLGGESYTRRFWNEVVVKSGGDIVEIGGDVAGTLGGAADKFAEEGPGLFKWAVVGLVAYVALQALRMVPR